MHVSTWFLRVLPAAGVLGAALLIGPHLTGAHTAGPHLATAANSISTSTNAPADIDWP